MGRTGEEPEKGGRRRGTLILLLGVLGGLLGKEAFVLAGLGVADSDSPAAASVIKNSTHRREKD